MKIVTTDEAIGEVTLHLPTTYLYVATENVYPGDCLVLCPGGVKRSGSGATHIAVNNLMVNAGAEVTCVRIADCDVVAAPPEVVWVEEGYYSRKEIARILALFDRFTPAPPAGRTAPATP